MVETLHAAITGRTRFRVKELYRCAPLKIHLERFLGANPAVISASASTLTSAVLVRYDSGAGPDHIRILIEEALTKFDQPCESGVPIEDRIEIGNRRERRSHSRHRPPSEVRPSCSTSSSDANYPTNACPWHSMGIEAVLAALGGEAESGLSSEAVRERLAAYGPDIVFRTPLSDRSWRFFSAS